MSSSSTDARSSSSSKSRFPDFMIVIHATRAVICTVRVVADLRIVNCDALNLALGVLLGETVPFRLAASLPCLLAALLCFLWKQLLLLHCLQKHCFVSAVTKVAHRGVDELGVTVLEIAALPVLTHDERPFTSVPVAAHLSDRASDPRRFGPDHLGVVRDDPAVALAVCAHEPPIREFDLAVPRIHRKLQRFLERVVLRAHPEVFALVLLRLRLLPAGVNVHTLSSGRMLERTLIRQLLRLLGYLLVPYQMLDSVHAAIHVMSHKSSFLELRR